MNEKAPGWRQWAPIAALTAAMIVAGIGTNLTDAAARNRARPGRVETFSNSTQIAIPSNALATPTSIVVSGLEAPIADVDVSLNNLTHPTASDLDIMLVGPGGRAVLLMSDTGEAAMNDSPTFSDQAANRLPSNAPVTSDTVQPTNDDYTGAPDTFPSPSPVATTTNTALAIFNGTDGNGTWTLFIREQDNVPVQTGSLGGWTLRITVANGVPRTNPDTFQAVAGQQLAVPPSGVLDNDSDPDGEFLTATLAGQPQKGVIQLESDGSFIYRANKKAKGTDSFTYLARDSAGLSALETVTIQINGKKHKKGRR